MKNSWLHFLLIILNLLVFNVFSQKGEEKYIVEAIAFYNLENLFDTIYDPLTNDAEYLPEGKNQWTSERYQLKLNNMAKVLFELGTDHVKQGAALVGVAEVENRLVLEDLVKTAPLAQRNWDVVHYDSPDKRGVDVGMLYNPKIFKVLNSKSVNAGVTVPDNPNFTTRDILLVEGVMHGDTLFVLVNHWPSRRGGEKRSRPLRNQAAATNKAIVDSISSVRPNAKCIVMGDLNDDPVNHSVRYFLNANGDIESKDKKSMYNPFLSYFQKGIGTLAYRDSWNLFDQIIVSRSFLNKDQDGMIYLKAEIFKRPYLFQTEGRFEGYPLRTFSFGTFINGYSDHLPTYILVGKRIE